MSLTGIELHKRYVQLHLACLRLFLESDDMEDARDRVSAPRLAWKAMGEALDALGQAEKERVVLLMTPDEIRAMVAQHGRLSMMVRAGSDREQ